MKILLVAIDSKFIHTNLAVRYLKANCDFPVDVMEFTIKDNIEKMLGKIIKKKPDLIGFSVYIWNLLIVQNLTKLIKENHPCEIVWGGPEASYEYEPYFEKFPIDFILRGEAELSFPMLVHALEKHELLDQVPGIVYLDKQTICSTNPKPIIDLDSLKNPYRLPEFYDTIPNKIQYVEASRGCPFHCTYCLASLDNQVRCFSLDGVMENILFLMQKGAKTFKFLDRTFNLNANRVMELIRFVVENHLPGTSFQFEISGDILSEALIDAIHAIAPKNLLRFEIGIQSTNPRSNLLVKRTQKLDVLFQNIRKIQKENVIDLHLDLIAGLPKENLTSFENTFNTTFNCYAKELQLGFLKMLKGTPIRTQAAEYGYVYNPNPPYEIVQNDHLSKRDIEQIRLVEKMLNIYWNKGFFTRSIRWIMERVASPFQFFVDLAHYYLDHQYDSNRYQLFEVFSRINDFLLEKYPEIQTLAFTELKTDYLLYHAYKPKIWWEQKSIHKNEIIRQYFQTDRKIPLDTLYKHSIVTKHNEGYMLVIYHLANPVVRYYYSK